ncbi:MAG: phage holin family protein [Roseburia sp.]|nr:phage holin family protein [Roseburia sp.]
MTGILSEMTDMVYQTRWLFLLALFLVIIDFWFGINVSKAQNIPIRWSRAGRRTLNKSIDYLCYITLGIVLGKAFGEPFGMEPHTLAIIVMLFCCGFEIDSIWSHICILHGIKKPVSVWRVILLVITFKFKEIKEELTEIGEKIEDAVEEAEGIKEPETEKQES